MIVSEWLLEILSVSLPMTALILLLCPLSRLTGTRFTAKCRYIVWTLVFVRLCIPLGLPFGMLELPSLVEIHPSAEETEETDVPAEILPEETVANVPEIEIFSEVTVYEPAEPPVSEAETAEIPLVPMEELPSFSVIPENAEAEELLPETESPAPPESPALPPAEEKNALSPLTVLGIIWLTGAAVYLGVHLIAYNRYICRLRRICKDAPADIRHVCRRLCRMYGIRRPPDVSVSRAVHSPLLCGYFRPRILLPDVRFSDSQAAGILAHELTHRRRHDLWVKLACVFGCALHWFNPAVHLAATRCCAEMELSCDEAVLAGMDEDARRSYGKVMLDLLRHSGGRPIILTTQFHPKKREVRERFLNIMDISKKKRGIAVILTAAILCSFAGMVFAYEAEPPADGENYIKINDNVSIRIGFGGLRPLLPPETEEDPAETEEKTEKTEDVPYEIDGLTFTLPAEMADLVNITEESQWKDGLFDVYHKASVEGGAPGWLYSVCRHTYDDLVRDDVNHGGIRYFAASPDNTVFYYLLAPTDVQFDPSDKETADEYEHLSDRWKTLTSDVTEKNGLALFDSGNIPDIVHLTADRTVYPSYAPAIYPIRLEYDEALGWLLRGDGAGPYGMALGDNTIDADLYAEWVTETCCRLAVDGEVYDLYRKDDVWALEKSDFAFGWENNLPFWTPTDTLTAASESDLIHRLAYERMDTEEFLDLETMQSAILREMTALVEPHRPESPDTATVHGDPYYVPDGTVFPENLEFKHLQIERNPAKRQEWTVWFKAGKFSLHTTMAVDREGDVYRLALTDPEFRLLQTIRADEGDLRPVLEELMTDPRTDYTVDLLVSGTKNARLTLEVSGEGRDLHQTKKIRLRSMKALGQTLTFDTPLDLWTVAAVHVFGADNAVVLDRLPTEYAGTTFLFTSRDIYEYSPRESFSMVLYEENDDLRYRHSSNLLNPQADNILGNATARDNFSYECGDVKLSGGRPQFYTADEYYTIDDVFDLDADFGTYWKSDAYPTLDSLLLYNAERYRDMNDYPTDEETPRPALTLDKYDAPPLPLTGHDVPASFDRDEAYTRSNDGKYYSFHLTTHNIDGRLLTSTVTIPQLDGTSAVIEAWNREIYERIRDKYAFLVYDYETGSVNNYAVNVHPEIIGQNGVTTIILEYSESAVVQNKSNTCTYAEVFHYDTSADKFLTNEEYLTRLTDGTMTMQSLLDRLNEQNTHSVLNGSAEAYAPSDLYGVLPSRWNDGGLDVILPAITSTTGGTLSDSTVTSKLHYVPGETYPTYTAAEGLTATYRVVRKIKGYETAYDHYYILCNIVDTRALPVPEENQSKRHILNPEIPEDYTFTFHSDYLSVNSVGATLTYTNGRGQLYERPFAFGERRKAEWYFGAYLEGKYDMDTLMKHTESVPVRVFNEVKAILDAYRDGERPSVVAPLFPADCAVPEIRHTDEILQYYRPSGESEHPIRISFPLENGQTLEIYWRIEEEDGEYTMIPRILIQPVPNVLLPEEANWNWWITDPSEVAKRLPAGDFEYNVSELTPEPLPSNKDGWSGSLLARTKFTVPDPTAELVLTCTVKGYAQVWLYGGLLQPSICLAEFTDADGTFTVSLTEEARQAILAGQNELFVHAEGSYFSLTLGES